MCYLKQGPPDDVVRQCRAGLAAGCGVFYIKVGLNHAAEIEMVEAEPTAESDVSQRAEDDGENTLEEGPVHRPLIRATLPRTEGQAPPSRPAPDFTIRQPGGPRPSHHAPGCQTPSSNRAHRSAESVPRQPSADYRLQST